MKRKNLYLSEIQIKDLQELAVQKGLSLAELVRRAIDNYVEQETGKKFKKQLERN